MDTEDPLRVWQHLHGATTHFPIALVFVSAVFDAGALLFKKTNWRTVGYWTLMATVIMLLPVVASGLYGIYVDAEGKDRMTNGGYNVARTILWHRNMSFFATAFLLIPAIWRTAKRDEITTAARVVCLLFVVIGAAFIAVVGYNGGYIPRGY